jgi:thiol-disulfide isomerase/thioredoxin
MPKHFPITRRKALAIAGYSLGISPLLCALDTSEPAPRFSAKTLAGETFNNQSLIGKVALIEFWATWCPYCRSDAEPLDDLAREFEKDGLVVLAVDVAESKKKVKAFLEQNPRKAKIVLMEDTNLAAVFEAKRFPQYVLINREGRVAGQQNGAGGEASLRRILRKAGLESRGGEDAPVELRSSPRRGA